MSGICGIVHSNARPVDTALLQVLTASLAFRGPDAQCTWCEGSVGFGHALLRTTFESERERQPASLDGHVFITADARIDSRMALVRQLVSKGQSVARHATDAELILHAYDAWDEDCVLHLIGDFAFAIWDDRKQRLFCARDQFGVKQFFYTRTGHSFIFSNTLQCLHLCPDVPDTLNDLAIADFLLFGANRDTATTSFASIFRLPPGHSLSLAGDKLRMQRYWHFPAEQPVRYRPDGEYVEQFQHLLELAVADRLRTRKLGVELSGGLDSTSVATVAKSLLKVSGDCLPIYAQSVVYDNLIPDQERRYAALVGERLGIDIDFVIADDFPLFDCDDPPGWHSPAPNSDPVPMRSAVCFRRAASQTRVMLTGWEGDGFLNESPKNHFRHLLRQRRLGRLLIEAFGHARSRRKLLPSGLLQWLNGQPPPHSSYPATFPEWIAPELALRLGLRERWNWVQGRADLASPAHPRALRTYAQLTEETSIFEYYDAGSTGYPLEYRHPLLDLRLLQFVLSLPPYPWCIQKHILRQTMLGRLPEAVRKRPKTALAGDPVVERLKRPEIRSPMTILAGDALSMYVSVDKIPRFGDFKDPDAAWLHLRPLCLELWLRLRRVKSPS